VVGGEPLMRGGVLAASAGVAIETEASRASAANEREIDMTPPLRGEAGADAPDSLAHLSADES
jgi:hypothetical protein